MHSRLLVFACLCAALLPLQARAQDRASDAGPAAAPEAIVAQAQRVTVEGHYDNAVGTSDAASQGTIRAELLKSRPPQRPGEVLEFVPGVIVTQHSGDVHGPSLCIASNTPSSVCPEASSLEPPSTPRR